MYFHHTSLFLALTVLPSLLFYKAFAMLIPVSQMFYFFFFMELLIRYFKEIPVRSKTAYAMVGHSKRTCAHDRRREVKFASTSS